MTALASDPVSADQGRAVDLLVTGAIAVETMVGQAIHGGWVAITDARVVAVGLPVASRTRPSAWTRVGAWSALV